MNLVILLFNNFETLDVFGPVEIFGKAEYKIQYYSMNGGLICNNDGISILTKMMDGIYFPIDVLLIPGGMGTRTEINNIFFTDKIKELANRSNCLSPIRKFKIINFVGWKKKKNTQRISKNFLFNFQMSMTAGVML